MTLPSAYSRRRFLAATALTGAGLVLAPHSLYTQNAGVATNRKSSSNVLNIALVGAGDQGKVLLAALKDIARDGILPFRLKAICDIWPYQQRGAISREKFSIVSKTTSEDGREEEIPTPLYSYYSDIWGYENLGDMLAREKDLDAIFIATPDFWHARHTLMSLRAGLHVYCESPMAHTLTDARSMLHAARETGKLLQIGYQLRSNPHYRYAFNILQGRVKLLGNLVGADAHYCRSARFNRDIQTSRGLRRTIGPSVLKRAGFENVHEFRNWRWFKKYALTEGGGVANHGLDTFHWWFGNPVSGQAIWGNDYCTEKRGYLPRESPDNFLCALTYKTPTGTLLARSQVRLNARYRFRHETLLGEAGQLELYDNTRDINAHPGASHRRRWEQLVREGILEVPRERYSYTKDGPKVETFNLQTAPYFTFPSRLGQKYLEQWHVENFLRAVRGEVDLHCPADVAFASEVPLYRLRGSGEIICFAPEDFE